MILSCATVDEVVPMNKIHSEDIVTSFGGTNDEISLQHNILIYMHTLKPSYSPRGHPQFFAIPAHRTNIEVEIQEDFLGIADKLKNDLDTFGWV